VLNTTVLGLRRLETAVVPRLRAFAESPEMTAIQWALPYSFVGLALGLAAFMLEQPSGSWLERFQVSFGPAFGVMSAALVVLLSFALARRRNVSPLAAVAGAVAAFVISLPHADGFANLAKALGSSGLFLAIGLALLSADSIVLVRTRLANVAGTVLGALVPVAFAALLRALGISLTEALDVAIAPLGNLGDSLSALLIITFVETILWTVGIHGPALLAAVVLPVYIRLQVQNTEALAHGLPLPHIVTVSTFLFLFPGGAGATLPLVLMLLRSRNKRDRRTAFATLAPSLFNANEPLMFGLPVVLNPYLGVPFVIAPLVLAVVTWEAMNLGLVAKPAYYIPSTIPLPVSVYLATNKDWRSIPLAALNLILAAAIYLPFVRIYAKHRRDEASE
jgi:PTS system cellobiose-specific IIC component